MSSIKSLYEFIDLAQKNRKYPANTAHGRRAALKLFETVLHADELESIELIEDRMGEIFLSLISRYKEKFSVQSLNTYKGRFLKVIQDYKKYGVNPATIANWEAKPRKYKDRPKDSNKDISLSNLSLPVHRHVHKIKITLTDGQEGALELPQKITKEDASILAKIIGALAD